MQVPEVQWLLPAEGGRPQLQDRAPAVRISKCWADHPAPAHVRPGTQRLNTGDGEIPLRLQRSFPSIFPVAHSLLPALPATVQPLPVCPAPLLTHRQPVVPRHKLRRGQAYRVSVRRGAVATSSAPQHPLSACAYPAMPARSVLLPESDPRQPGSGG
ncbi:hypothetical protein D3C73_1093290 [compost metagenome]